MLPSSLSCRRDMHVFTEEQEEAELGHAFFSLYLCIFLLLYHQEKTNLYKKDRRLTKRVT